MMKIAVLGAGFAGLGTALSLLLRSRGKISLDLFDPLPIGSGVSGLSAGLLHPFAGKKAELAWNAEKLLNASHFLITEASIGLSQSVISSQGILRPAISTSQIESFQKTAQNYPKDTIWWNREKALDAIPGLHIEDPKGGALFIKNGLTLNVKHYLEGLYQRALRFGLQYHNKVPSEKELNTFDRIILAIGIHTKNIPSLENLPLYPLKGQSLRLLWPPNLPPLAFSLISEGYIVMEPGLKTCVVGATFERKFTDSNPDVNTAAPLIREKIGAYFPSLVNAEILECQSGIRAIYSKTSMPIAGRITNKYWFITGLGSKGLLFHGFMAEALCQAVLADNDYLIPSFFRYVQGKDISDE